MAGVKGKSGGRRKGGGRKPSAYTQLKRRLQAEKTDDADYAFSLYAEVMRNPNEPTEMRLTAADWVSNRVLGKPAQMQPTDAKDELYQQHLERLRKVMFADEPESARVENNEPRGG